MQTQAGQAALIEFVEGARDAGLTKSPAYDAAKKGTFVTPIKIGRKSLMLTTERDALLRAHVQGLPEDEIRSLVSDLHAARQRGGI